MKKTEKMGRSIESSERKRKKRLDQHVRTLESNNLKAMSMRIEAIRTHLLRFVVSASVIYIIYTLQQKHVHWDSAFFGMGE